jgi:hypothetical protein
MKIFAIRLENGDTAIVSGEHSGEALQNAGITAHVLQELQQQGIGRDHADLVLDGFGPQQYEIRELLHVAITLRIDQLGNFHLADMNTCTYDALSQGYPILESTMDEIAKRWPDPIDVENHRAEHDWVLEDALSKERTRLMLPSRENNEE